VADFCCVSLVLHYLNDILCKNYNYMFVFAKVIPKTLLVPFFFGHGVVDWVSKGCGATIVVVLESDADKIGNVTSCVEERIGSETCTDCVGKMVILACCIATFRKSELLFSCGFCQLAMFFQKNASEWGWARLMPLALTCMIKVCQSVKIHAQWPHCKFLCSVLQCAK